MFGWFVGLIITQSGQAYYVNEQGIPIAQGIAPSQFLPEALLPRSSSASSSPVQTTNGSQLSIAPAAQLGAPATVVTTTATITPVVTSTAITTSGEMLLMNIVHLKRFFSHGLWMGRGRQPGELGKERNFFLNCRHHGITLVHPK